MNLKRKLIPAFPAIYFLNSLLRNDQFEIIRHRFFDSNIYELSKVSCFYYRTKVLSGNTRKTSLNFFVFFGKTLFVFDAL